MFAYIGLLLRLLVVSFISIILYIELIEFIDIRFQELFLVPGLLNQEDSSSQYLIFVSLKILLGALFCWRMVKVFVFHGVPNLLGLKEEVVNRPNGRPVNMIYCATSNDNEQSNDRFWYCAVFPSHMISDKKFRSRLELLIMAIPFATNHSLIVQHNKIRIKKFGHLERRSMFRNTTKKHRTPLSARQSYEKA